MGGDHGPSVILPASLMALSQYSQLKLILVGDETLLNKRLQKYRRKFKSVFDRLVIHHASQSVEMDEEPAHALRSKKDSSMRVAINLVKENLAQACVSAGNTGALMAIARFVLKTIPGIDRPAIVSSFPTRGKSIFMLDLGANVDSSAEQLLQFALMGSVLASAVGNITHPQVCLLNIGEEDIKGNEQVKASAQLLSNFSSINYAGFIEGDEIFNGTTDVVVCDGFVGNVALKTSEGTAIFIGRLLKEAYNQNWLTKFVGLLSLPILKRVIKRINPDFYNGATLIGLKGIVIKSHGSAKAAAFTQAITKAFLQIEKNIPEQISSAINKILPTEDGNKSAPL